MASLDSEWKVLLMNGEPAITNLKKSGIINLAEGVQIFHQIFLISGGGDISKSTVDQVISTEAPASGTDAASQITNSTEEISEPCRRTERIIMIMGFAAGGHAWLPLIHRMILMLRASGSSDVFCDCLFEVCVVDNRGIGKSSVPTQKTAYTTAVMAQDTLGVMDALGWPSAHIVGHSMGGMISMKLAALRPRSVKSLLILSVTGGNWQIIPTRGSSLKNALRGLLNSDDEGKASIDVHFHFCKTTRRARHGGEDLESLLVKEYMSTMKVHGRQRPEGEAGHINACWTHNVSDKEIESIRSGGFPMAIMHGHDDLVAMTRYAAKMADRLEIPLLLVHGGHFIPRECAPEVAGTLLDLISEASGHATPAAADKRRRLGRAHRGLLDLTASSTTSDDPLIDSASKQRRRKSSLTGCFGCCS